VYLFQQQSNILSSSTSLYQGGRQNGGVSTLLFVSIPHQNAQHREEASVCIHRRVTRLKIDGILGVPGLLPFLLRSPWVAVSRRLDGSPSPRIDKTRPSPQWSSPLSALGYSKMSLFNRELDLRDYHRAPSTARRLETR
jgi:hypothetical protein